MFLLEKIRNMDEKMDQVFVYARRICHDAQQVIRDVHRYQQSITEIGAFLRDIKNKGFIFLPVNDDDE